MQQCIYRLFGVSQETVQERLRDILAEACVTVTLSYAFDECCLQLSSAETDALTAACAAVEQRLGTYIYSYDDATLEQKTVASLKEKGLTVALAESCTGGLVAARLTTVAGCSQVFGTGVVSYSWECKQQLLDVSARTLEQHGAVSAATAREMADGIRRRSGAAVGVAITGEAGPQAAEQQPVGTVFVALADKKRVWVEELHLDGDRDAVRRVAASYALDKLRRYALAYPTVMAGGERLNVNTAHHRERPSVTTRGHGIITALLPWRGTRRLRVVKVSALLAVALVIVSGFFLLYNQILAPASNREFQDDLADMYWENIGNLTADDPLSDRYPLGMRTQFRGLYDMNKDIAGWVRIADTAVNYPVTLDADGYYVNHNFSDQYSVYGQPYFAGMDSHKDLQANRLLVVKGNNTRDEQMFSSLLSYRRIAYLRDNPIIELNTLYTEAAWQIFAVALVDERDASFSYAPASFADDAAYMTYLQQLQRRSLYVADGALSADTQTLLLVTDAGREYGFSDARLVIAACRVDAEEVLPLYEHNTQVVWPAAYTRRTSATTDTTTRPTTTTSTTVASTTVMDITTQPSKETTHIDTTTNSTTTASSGTTQSSVTTVSTTADKPSTTVTEPLNSTTVTDAPSTTLSTVDSSETVTTTTQEADEEEYDYTRD